MKKPFRILVVTLSILVAILALAAIAVFLLVDHPRQIQPAFLESPADASELRPGQEITVLSWNVQYFAGKGYVFFYDLWDGSGPDEKPSEQAIALTLEGAAALVRELDPDLILLQEIDQDSGRTYFGDQLALFRGLIGPEWRAEASAWYWRAAFVPHPRVMSKVGMKLAILSKYGISSATRHQLPRMGGDPVTRAFNFRRAVLEARLPIQGGSELAVLTTHLDAFAQGAETMALQVAKLESLLDGLSAEGVPWIASGDFNLLPPGPAYDDLPPDQSVYYQKETELARFFEKYASVPSAADMAGPERAAWYTHFPNDPAVSAPDRTIDYFFFPKALRLEGARVVRDAALGLSDHLPLVARFVVP